MKTKIFITTMLISIIHSSFAQLTNVQEQDGKKKWGCSVSINSVEAQIGDPEYDSWGYATGNYRNFADKTDKSYSISIIPKYFITNDILLRFEIGITNINLSTYYDAHTNNSQTTTIIQNQTIEQKIYRYLPGVQWNFIKKKFIESYCGVSGIYLHYNTMNYTDRFETRDLPSNTITGGFYDQATATGGFASGVGTFAGLNIYLNKYVSFGAEFSSALLYYKIGGVFEGVSVDLINPNPSTTQTYSYSTSLYRGTQFSKILSSFNISVWL